MLMLALPLAVPAQEYQAPKVEISKDKVKVDGKAYYAHVVSEKQTLFSICKAYGVSVDSIYEANENLNLRTEGLKQGQVLLIPVKAAGEAPEPVFGGGVTEPGQTGETQDARSLFPRLRDLFEKMMGGSRSYSKDIPEVINVAVLLPFGAGGNADEKSLDFYSGVLLAARDLGRQGLNIKLTAADISAAAPSSPLLKDSDIILGPISVKDVKTVAGRCEDGKYLISPLEPKTAELVDSLDIVHAPTPASWQNEDLVKWATGELRYGDSLVLVSQAGVALNGEAKAFADELNASKRRYRRLSYSVSRGIESQDHFVNAATKRGTTRFIIASENESFVNDAVRNIALLAYKGYDVALYAPSRIRSYSLLETENLHQANAHVAAGYFVDYESPKVREFVLAYRALYGGEPNSFAFHGYDTMHYFTNICHNYGRMWDMKLDEYRERGLQTDFIFAPDKGDGRVNTAVRHIVYTPDYRIILE